MSGIKPSTVVHPIVIETPTQYIMLPMPSDREEDMGTALSAQKANWLKNLFKNAATKNNGVYYMLFLDTVYIVRPDNATCMKLTGATARQKRKDMKLMASSQKHGAEAHHLFQK